MSEYELANLFNEQLRLQQSLFMNYVTVLFAFLIAAYLAADKLKPSMVIIIVGLFTVMTFQMVPATFGAGHDFASVATKIALRATDGQADMSWHGAATPWGAGAINIVRFGSFAMLIISYLAGLIFFFHQRHVGRA